MRTKLVAGFAAAGVLVGGGAAAAAVGATSSSAQAATVATVAADTGPAAFAHAPLASLVANGTITQAQANAVHDAIYKYMQDHRPYYNHGQTPPVLTGALDTVLNQLVKDGTINQSQASAVKKVITEQVQEHWQSRDGSGRQGQSPRAGQGPWWDDAS